MARVLPRWWITSSIVLGCLATLSPARAQIVPDNTLPVNSSVTPGCTACTIDGGTERGVNLFHSFSEFSVPTGGEAFFNNALQIQNIFSRVTGNSVSNIDGLLRTNGTASLFFLNPNGVIFGSNARLEIGGSFFATTANSFKFPDGSEFSATNPQAPPLLTVNVTPGVQWGASQPGATITNRGNLVVGQDLTLAAGNLDLQGQLVAGRDLTLQAQDTVKVRDSATSPFIASADGKLLVEGTQAIDIFALNHPDSGLFSGGDMVLRSANTVEGDAHYWSGGSFRIEKLDGSLGDLYSPYDPIIRSLGDVSFDAYQGTSLHILAGGEVNIGTVVITGAAMGAAGVDYLQETVQLSNGKEISIDGSLQPTLDIRAGVAPAFIGVPGVTGFNPATDRFFGQGSLTDAPTSADITIGDVQMVPPNGLVFITNQYQPNTALPGGDINITGAGVFGYGIDARGFGGNGSSVILDSRRNMAITNSRIDSSSNAGNAGDISLLANETVSVKNSFVFSNTFGAGEGGDINIQARQLLVTDGAQVSASTLGEGKGGSLIVNASQAVQLMGTSADGQVRSGLFAQTAGTGDGGDVEITAPVLQVTDGAVMNVSSFDQGKGGNLIINASQAVQVIGTSADGEFSSGLAAETYGIGDGGNVQITTPVLLVTDGAAVSVSTFGEGKGGSLIVNASQAVQLIGGRGLFAETEGTGDGGNVQITTGLLLVKDGAVVNVSTPGQGNSGSLIVNASQAVQLIGESADGRFGSGLAAQTNGTGDGENVQITTPWLLVTDGAGISVSTFGEGNGGSLIVNASQAVQLIGRSADGKVPSGLNAGTQGTGNGGNIEITTPWLLVTDGAGMSATTTGEGQGGSLIVNASQAVHLIGSSADGESGSGLFAQTNGIGDGGNVQITTPWLLVTDGARVSATTFGEGNGGSLIVNSAQAVQIIDPSPDDELSSGLFALSFGKGHGGNVQITAPWLLVTDGAVVNVSTAGEGNGGSLIVNASEAVQLIGTSADGEFPSGLAASTLGTGDAGDIEISTTQLLVTNGARVSAATFSEGNGGSLIINASEKVQLSGTGGLFVDATAGSTAGDLIVTTNEMFVTDGAGVSVSSPQGQAGNLSITANSLTLNRGTLSAITAESAPAKDGANITLSGLEFLRMDNESLISASALETANGGNVTIDSTLIVATPPTGSQGSDIIANAEQGNGGRVNVTTQGLFGIEFRPQRTPKNDITVSSTFGLSGEFALNTPGVDPSRGLAALPANVVDASQKIDQRCTASNKERGSNSFTITGRGGMPPSPNDTLQGESVITPNWITLNSEENNIASTPTTPRSSAPKQLVEAQGWSINEQGQVVLTASSPNVTPHDTWQTPTDCPTDANSVQESMSQ
jgi:filamentous hemagglutinin family protein